MIQKWKIIFSDRAIRFLTTTTVILLLIYGYFYFFRANSTSFKFFLDFFPEFIGIIITIFIIDRLFERAKNREDIESLAWDVLHRADYIVWVWQGGARIYDYAELIHLLKNIEERDQLALETQNLILSFGNDTANMINSKRKLIKSNPKFVKALNEFSKLSKIRDNGKEKPVKDIAKSLREGIEILAVILKVNYSQNSDFSHLPKDCSKESQTWRHTGVGKDILKRRIEEGVLY